MGVALLFMAWQLLFHVVFFFIQEHGGLDLYISSVQLALLEVPSRGEF